MPAQNAQSASAAQKNELATIAHRRLYPSLTNPSYLVLRSRRLLFSNWTRTLGNNLTVLDVGGRYQPYRPLLAPAVARYVAVDLIKTELTSVLADGAALPFVPRSFDLVIATQVLDYIADPKTAIRQIHLVLKPGGIFLASAPAFAPRFADSEQWRFTRTGLSTLLSPFSRVEIVAELSSVGSVFRTLNLAGDTFVRYHPARAIYRYTACPILNLLGLGFESLHLTTNDQFAANYSIFATK
jgi:SAM-dependent methyltransferase